MWLIVIKRFDSIKTYSYTYAKIMLQIILSKVTLLQYNILCSFYTNQQVKRTSCDVSIKKLLPKARLARFQVIVQIESFKHIHMSRTPVHAVICEILSSFLIPVK